MATPGAWTPCKANCSCTSARDAARGRGAGAGAGRRRCRMAAAACTADDRRALRRVTETLSSMAATPPRRLPAGARSQRSLRPCVLWLAPPRGKAATTFDFPTFSEFRLFGTRPCIAGALGSPGQKSKLMALGVRPMGASHDCSRSAFFWEVDKQVRHEMVDPNGGLSGAQGASPSGYEGEPAVLDGTSRRSKMTTGDVALGRTDA